jgi:ABC-type transporter Mla subunit MlaD
LQSLANSTTDLFFLAITLMFFIALYFRNKGHHPNLTEYAPTLLASLGILGTFAGIIIGLIAFDPTAIDNSIADLLGGLQTGFLTSLYGIFLSITYKVIESLMPDLSELDADNLEAPQSDRDILLKQQEFLQKIAQSLTDENSDASLLNLMKLYRSDTNDHRKNQSKQVTEIKDLLEGNKASQEALLNQAEKHSQFQQEFSTELWRKLDSFAEMLSKSATEQVINALNQVIADFNAKLTEQFGENFKQLNMAVESLVQWQENYRQQISQMTEQYAQGVVAITKTEASVTNISNESSKIPTAMESLKSVIEVNQHQLDNLASHLEVFSQMRDKAVDAVPQINQRIDETIQGVTAASQQLSNAIIKTATEFDDSASRVNGSLQSTSDLLSTNSEEIKQLLNDTVSQLNESIRNLIEQTIKQQDSLLKSQNQSTISLLDGFKKAENEIESFAKNTLKSTEETVSRQVNTIDRALEQEINKTMNDMGSALTSITARFTQDYKQLVDEMQQVIRANRTTR